MNLPTMLAVINVITFFLFLLDKQAAKVGAQRIREHTLWIAAAAFGALGATLGMFVFRHKTRHRNFRVILPILVVVQAMLLCFLWNYIYF